MPAAQWNLVVEMLNLTKLTGWTNSSLRKQPTFGDVTTGLPAKWRLRNKRRNSTLMTHHYPDLGSAFDWSCGVGNLIQPITSTSQIWVVMHHQYGISALVSQTSFGGETGGSVTKCRLFSQAKQTGAREQFPNWRPKLNIPWQRWFIQ